MGNGNELDLKLRGSYLTVILVEIVLKYTCK